MKWNNKYIKNDVNIDIYNQTSTTKAAKIVLITEACKDHLEPLMPWLHEKKLFWNNLRVLFHV